MGKKNNNDNNKKGVMVGVNGVIVFLARPFFVGHEGEIFLKSSLNKSFKHVCLAAWFAAYKWNRHPRIVRPYCIYKKRKRTSRPPPPACLCRAIILLSGVSAQLKNDRCQKSFGHFGHFFFLFVFVQFMKGRKLKAKK